MAAPFSGWFPSSDTVHPDNSLAMNDNNGVGPREFSEQVTAICVPDSLYMVKALAAANVQTDTISNTARTTYSVKPHMLLLRNALTAPLACGRVYGESTHGNMLNLRRRVPVITNLEHYAQYRNAGVSTRDPYEDLRFFGVAVGGSEIGMRPLDEPTEFTSTTEGACQLPWNNSHPISAGEYFVWSIPQNIPTSRNPFQPVTPLLEPLTPEAIGYTAERAKVLMAREDLQKKPISTQHIDTSSASDNWALEHKRYALVSAAKIVFALADMGVLTINGPANAKKIVGAHARGSAAATNEGDDFGKQLVDQVKEFDALFTGTAGSDEDKMYRSLKAAKVATPDTSIAANLNKQKLMLAQLMGLVDESQQVGEQHARFGSELFDRTFAPHVFKDTALFPEKSVKSANAMMKMAPAYLFQADMKYFSSISSRIVGQALTSGTKNGDTIEVKLRHGPSAVILPTF